MADQDEGYRCELCFQALDGPLGSGAFKRHMRRHQLREQTGIWKARQPLTAQDRYMLQALRILWIDHRQEKV